MIVKILDLKKEKCYRKWLNYHSLKSMEYGDIIIYRFNKIGIINKINIKEKVIILLNNN